MAVIGRTKSQRYLAAQAAMLASMSALPKAKNTLASVSRLWPRRRDRTWVIRAQWPGGTPTWVRLGSVGPVFGGDLLAIVEVRGQGGQVVDVLGIKAVQEPVGAGNRELPRGAQRKP